MLQSPTFLVGYLLRLSQAVGYFLCTFCVHAEKNISHQNASPGSFVFINEVKKHIQNKVLKFFF